MIKSFLIAGFIVMALAACGDKVPESKAAKEVGNIPKQTIDKATAGANDAIKQGAERLQKEDDKKE